MSDRKNWPPAEALEQPPADLATALAMPLRAFAGCWIAQNCRCGRAYGPVRLVLTGRPIRADMPLRRAVVALSWCERCGDQPQLALVFNPQWRTP